MDFFRPGVTQGLQDLFLIFEVLRGACLLDTLLNIWRNLERLSLESLLFKTKSIINRQEISQSRVRFFCH